MLKNTNFNKQRKEKPTFNPKNLAKINLFSIT